MKIIWEESDIRAGTKCESGYNNGYVMTIVRLSPAVSACDPKMWALLYPESVVSKGHTAEELAKVLTDSNCCRI